MVKKAGGVHSKIILIVGCEKALASFTPCMPERA